MFNTILNKITGAIAKTANGIPDLATKNKISELLKISPERYAEFEAAYKKQAIDYNDGNLFSVNSRHVSQEMHAVTDIQPLDETVIESINCLTDRIVDELLAETKVFTYDGKSTYRGRFDEPTAAPVTREEIAALPEAMRPQLAGNLMTKDITNAESIDMLAFYLSEMQKNPNNPKGRSAYHHFRQGLDILDLDWITYKIIETNPISMGHWLPALIEANTDKTFFKIPKTTICSVPMTLLQLTRLDYERLTPTTLNIIDKWAMKAFNLDDTKEYFIRTGTHSSKFDFRNAYVHDPKEVHEIGEYLTYIHHQGVMMAGYPLSPHDTQASIYGMSTTTEWAVREFIQDKENNPEIYKGLPLHTEYRVFVDCDTNTVLSIVPYWEPETMKKRFGHEEDADSPHQIHDYIIYQMHEETLMNRYHANKDTVKTEIEKLLPDLNLTGQWSIDVMQNGDDFWLIDMATAKYSAFYDSVPAELRNPQPENWLPDLSA